MNRQLRSQWWIPLWWFNRAVMRSQLRNPFEVFGEIRVHYESIPTASREVAIDRVAQALYVIFKFDGRRHYRLRRDGTEILLIHGAGGHKYEVSSNVIILDLRMLEGQTPLGVATSIVHEATHARFATAGVRAHRRSMLRIETRCVEEEIAFVRRLPGASDADLAAWEAEKRDRLKHQWWERRVRLRTLADSQEEAGTPAWIIRLLRLFS